MNMRDLLNRLYEVQENTDIQEIGEKKNNERGEKFPLISRLQSLITFNSPLGFSIHEKFCSII